jgi:hypothetical protein
MARRHVVGLMVSAGLCLSIAAKVNAHCDTENGPVAVAARTALKTGAFDGIVIWVGEAQQKELHARFDEARTVYGMGGQAKKLAERYFMETAVRLHREEELPADLTRQGRPPILVDGHNDITGRDHVLAHLEELSRLKKQWYTLQSDACYCEEQGSVE